MNHPILVVDDDPAIRDAVRDVLEMEGLPVETAADGSEALVKITARAPRLVLLDMRMPGLDGWGFARELRAAGIELPVVVMTAAADARRWAEEIGAVAVMAKPFGVGELMDVVRTYGR
ncbi:MAG TPA: response regulator [candidate division Zixibacteria bacterium]|nr:response regulator [candidate division Zixibacteria bacterium]